jgi:hypothetical protein
METSGKNAPGFEELGRLITPLELKGLFEESLGER